MRVSKETLYFKGKVKNHDSMTNPENGWVEGLYFQDLCGGEIKHFIRSGEMIWEVIPESIHQQLPLKDTDGNILCDGDIVNILCNDGSNANCLIGFNKDDMAWGLMEAHYYKLMKEGHYKIDDFRNTFLLNCFKGDTVIRIMGNIFENEKLLMSE